MSLTLNPLGPPFDVVKTRWGKGVDTVSSSSSLVVDTEPLASFEARNYFVSIKRVSDDKIRTFNLNVVKNGATVKDSLFGRVGGSLSVSIDTQVVASNYELKITNNNAGSDIEIIFLKSKI